MTTSRSAQLRRRPAVTPLAVAFLAVVLPATAAGCGDNGTSDLPPPPAARDEPATAATTADPTEQAILAAYRGSVQAMVAAQAAGDPDHPDLTRYFSEQTPALSNVRSGLARNDARGTYYAGELVVVDAAVTGLDLAADPPEATIESCLDDTGYRLVYRDDGSAVPDTEPGGRYRVSTTALRDTDRRWYIATTTARWDESC